MKIKKLAQFLILSLLCLVSLNCLAQSNKLGSETIEGDEKKLWREYADSSKYDKAIDLLFFELLLYRNTNKHNIY